MTPLSGERLKEIEARLGPLPEYAHAKLICTNPSELEAVCRKVERELYPANGAIRDLLSHIASLTKPVDGEEVAGALKTLEAWRCLNAEADGDIADDCADIISIIRRLSTARREAERERDEARADCASQREQVAHNALEASAEARSFARLLDEGLCDEDGDTVPLTVEDDSDPSVGLFGSPYLVIPDGWTLVKDARLTALSTALEAVEGALEKIEAQGIEWQEAVYEAKYDIVRESNDASKILVRTYAGQIAREALLSIRALIGGGG